MSQIRIFIAHTLEDTLAPDGSHVLVFNWAWLFLAAMLHVFLVILICHIIQILNHVAMQVYHFVANITKTCIMSCAYDQQ